METETLIKQQQGIAISDFLDKVEVEAEDKLPDGMAKDVSEGTYEEKLNRTTTSEEKPTDVKEVEIFNEWGFLILSLLFFTFAYVSIDFFVKIFGIVMGLLSAFFALSKMR